MIKAMWMWIQAILRLLVGTIDGLLYSLGAELYGLMMDIASAKVFSNETIQDVSMRVYQLLGLVMLFRLIFAFLTYVINPEDMTDKNKGYTKIIQKIFTSLALVIITPWLFTQSRNLQIYIINDHLIEYFIFGTSGSSQAKPGYDLMYTVSKIFYVPYECDSKSCDKKRDRSTSCSGVNWDKNIPKFEKSGDKHVLDKSAMNEGKCGYGTNNDDYANLLWKATRPDSSGNYPLRTLTGLAYDYDGDNFKIDFQWPFVGSTLVGGFICYVLLIMCMDIALRSVKLAFYEMIAPVPILSNLGFKDGKDSMLNKWFHEVLKTYADLFTRVAGLQISIFAIQELVNNGLAKNDSNIFVTLFLIIGALMFAKKLPDILKGMGINFEGGGSFNIKKKLSEGIPTGAKRLGAAGLGLLGGFAANGYKAGSNFWKAHRENQKLREEMQKQGYTKFDKNNREDFYSRNAKNQELGSVKHRRQYLGSKSAIDARKNAAGSDHIKRMSQIRSDEAKYLANARSEEEKANISAHFNKLRTAEGQRYSDELNKAESRKAKREFTKDNASDSWGVFTSPGSVIAGTVSSAIRAATTKDGKLFAGAAEGVRKSNDARDTRDKQQGVDYDLGTRVWDTVRSFSGVDTAAKGKANELRDEISKLQSDAYAYQQQASSSMQSFMTLKHLDSNDNALNFTPKDLEDYIRNPNDFVSRGMTRGMTDAEVDELNEAANAYNQATQNYSSTQTKITKTTKKIGLYEKEKK